MAMALLLLALPLAMASEAGQHRCQGAACAELRLPYFRLPNETASAEAGSAATIPTSQPDKSCADGELAAGMASDAAPGQPQSSEVRSTTSDADKGLPSGSDPKPPADPTGTAKESAAEQTQAPVCEDTNHQCEGWAKLGECARNAKWMKTSCCKSCDGAVLNTAAASTAVEVSGKQTQGSCTDKLDECQTLAASGECERSPSVMDVACCSSCSAVRPGRDLSAAPSKAASVCEDTNPMCQIWASLGQCKVNPDQMRSECCASCNHPCCELCEAYPHPKCEDTLSNCPQLADSGSCKSDPSMVSSCCKSCEEVTSRVAKLACMDTFSDCQMWARTGECLRNPPFLNERCCATCTQYNAYGRDMCADTASQQLCEERVKQGKCISDVRTMANECCNSCLHWQQGGMQCTDMALTEHGATECSAWAAKGACLSNPGFMTVGCCSTCTHPCCSNCVKEPA